MLEILLISAGAISGDAVHHAVLPAGAMGSSVVSQDDGVARVRAAGASGAAAHGDERVRTSWSSPGLTLGMLGDLLLALRFLAAEAAPAVLRGWLGVVFPGPHRVYSRRSWRFARQAWTVRDPHCGRGAGRGQLLRLRQGGARRARSRRSARCISASVLFMTACAATGAFIELEPGAVPVLRRRHLLLDER